MDIRTVCIHGGDFKNDQTGSISVPIYQSATFGHPELGESTGYDYGRVQNPTRHYLEQAVGELEHGADCLACSTGMAAIALTMELFKPGDEVIATDDLYGGTIRLFRSIHEKNGIRFHMVNTADLQKTADTFTKQVKAVYIETPTNPMMQITDIRKIAALAHAHGALLIVDNTFMSPYLCNPIDFGADIVIHSGTKYIAGHNDTLAGFIIPASQELTEKLRFLYKTTGYCLGAFDSWLVLRGIKTLAVRMEAQEKNAEALARWIASQKQVSGVLHPSLPEFAGAAVHFSQCRGSGAMLSFYTDTHETALRILKSVRVIRFAESLGGTESLITYPATQTHCDLTEEERKERGITSCLLRLSVGLEGLGDLIADLEQAIQG